MDPISREAFEQHLGKLTAEEFAAFVAALWAERGATTRVAGRVVHVQGRGRSARRIRVVHGRQVPADLDAGVDAVALSGRLEPRSWGASVVGRLRGRGDGAAATDAEAVDVLDAADLREMLLYAVPRPAATDLCRRFFDRELLEPTADATSGEREAGALVEHSATLVVGALGLALLVVGLVGGPVAFGAGDEVAFGAPDSFGPNADRETPTPTPTAEPAASAGGSTVDVTGPFPPGVGAEGVTSADRLADAHAKAATGQSYRLTLTHREYVDGGAAAYRRETVYVETPTRYLTVLEGAGTLTRPDMVISEMEAYADGEIRYERRVIADEFEPTYTYRSRTVSGVRNGEGRYADRAETYVSWFLSVEESTVVDSFRVDGTRYYWLRLGDDPYPGITNASGSALVDETGFVHEVRRQYDVPREPNVSVVVSIRYTDVGDTVVTEPTWLSATGVAAVQPDGTTLNPANATAENATAATTTSATAENATAEDATAENTTAGNGTAATPTG